MVAVVGLSFCTLARTRPQCTACEGAKFRRDREASTLHRPENVGRMWPDPRAAGTMSAVSTGTGGNRGALESFPRKPQLLRRPVGAIPPAFLCAPQINPQRQEIQPAPRRPKWDFFSLKWGFMRSAQMGDFTCQMMGL